MNVRKIGLAFGLACALFTFSAPAQAVEAAAVAAKPAPRVLMVITSHTELRGTGKKTGFWFEELATPYYLFRDAGYDVQIASVRGGRTQADPVSAAADVASIKRFQADAEAMRGISRTQPVSKLSADNYDAVFLVGGYGALWDFANDGYLRRLLQAFVNADKPVAAVGHGISAVVELSGPNGAPLVRGRKMTGYTHAEEKITKLDTVVPFYIDSQLINAGAKVETSAPFKPHSVQDGKLITGQNYSSAEGVAKLLIKTLKNNSKISSLAR